ncbi:Crp/Fnr family transcriptional regulator [Bacillus sp. B15-48]|uniref:Crp/Fnr family transcriptional regulator n=1 Tax=Bacillus sp. B15-48 TaxID=1548601 RepID=UPI00193F5057|nr:Crp/Fnr family transcriptional regulator [Bacillus sp. B15-48]MBM4761178.1 helix-turn-helix domain-containing protein [Bacillus sp. B15-48]
MEDLIAAISMAPEPQQEYLQQLFKNIPISSRSCRVVKMKADTKFISANSVCNEIWILIEGRIRAIEEQISGDVYVFTEFQAPQLFGEVEGLSGLSSYKATLVTSTDCQFIVLPMENYLNWIRNDSEALFLRTRTTMKFILEQTKKERTYLFLDGIDRLMLFLTKYYRKHAKNKSCIIQMNRQQIADETGLSTKTVNRSIKKLSDEGILTKQGGKIVISDQHYEHLLETIDKKFSK